MSIDMSGDIMDRKFRDKFKLVVLYLLKEEPLHGYAIMKKFEEIFKAPKPSSGLVYPTLFRLKHLNFIETVGEGKREKKIYRLTREGMNFLNKHEKELEEILKKLRIFAEISELGGKEIKDSFSLLMETYDELSEEQKKKISEVMRKCAGELRNIISGGE